MVTPPEEPHAAERERLSRQEYISAMVHFYRGEMQRATSWRLRLDNTTNWAIISAGGLVTFAFGHPDIHQVILVLGLALLIFFLWIESRRYRYFDVWRSRVRKLEENFFGPVLMRRLASPDPGWAETVAADLARPVFKISHWHALHLRLRSNYFILFLLILVAWIAKILLHPYPMNSFMDFKERLAIGLVPWWATPLVLSVTYGLLALVCIVPGKVMAAHGHRWDMSENTQQLL